jgi:PilZ domain
VQTRHRFYAAPARSAAGVPDSISEPTPRDDARVPVFTIAANIFIAGEGAPWCCTVRDISRGGARLELDRVRPPRVSEQLPDQIVLYFCPDRTEVQCRIAWRDGRHFGVQFTGEIAASTRRPV